MSASFFNTMCSPTLHSTGVGRRRSRRDGALAGDRPETGGGPRDGTRKAWPLLVSSGSHSLSVQFESNAGGHAGASWGDGGVVRLPRFVSDGMLLTVTDALSFSGGTMSKFLTTDVASEYLGTSKLTLYGWGSARKLGFIKVGRLAKFKQEHLDKWIDQHTVKAWPAAQERVADRSEHG